MQKGVGPDEESKRVRTSSKVRTINTSAPSLPPPSLRSRRFAVSLPLAERGYPRNLAGLSLYTSFSPCRREDREIRSSGPF